MSLIPQDRSKLSPMMQQYLSMKDEHRDQILMFRLGDFYEMFFDDAVTASRELELTLTGRDCGLPDRAPMCGVPYHSVENYIARLVKKGYKVAICEQMENPALAKGMVKRDIVRVVTPGTLMEANMLEEGSNNYICSLCPAGERCGLAFADISTGSVLVTEVSGEMAAINELGIGPQGFGGRTTCLGLAIEQMPTHVAGLPVAVNVSCHVTRRASAAL